MSRLIKLEAEVDLFAEEMKKKLRSKARAGKQGWASKNWPIEDKKRQLLSHVQKGDPVDVANYAMFWRYHQKEYPNDQ